MKTEKLNKCTCCQAETETTTKKCKWEFFEVEQCMKSKIDNECRVDIEVCWNCEICKSKEWLCYEHQYEHEKKLQLKKVAKNNFCDYVGYGPGTCSPVNYQFSPIKPTNIFNCNICDKYYKICKDHPDRFYLECENCLSPDDERFN